MNKELFYGMSGIGFAVGVGLVILSSPSWIWIPGFIFISLAAFCLVCGIITEPNRTFV